MQKNRLSEEYKKGVLDFLTFAKTNLPKSNERFHCPCAMCVNIEPLDANIV